MGKRTASTKNLEIAGSSGFTGTTSTLPVSGQSSKLDNIDTLSVGNGDSSIDSSITGITGMNGMNGMNAMASSGTGTPNSSILATTPVSGRRRSSFLSPSMMHEVHNAFEVGTSEDGSPRYSLSLKEAQGFLWNTDIFVSRHYRAMLDMDGFHDRAPEVREIHVDENDDIFPSDY